MRVQEVREQVTSPARPAPFQDEVAWGELVDGLIAAVREEERLRTVATLEQLATSAIALSSVGSVSSLIGGIMARDYAPPTHLSAHD